VSEKDRALPRLRDVPFDRLLLHVPRAVDGLVL
jgi:hypothetical protein